MSRRAAHARTNHQHDLRAAQVLQDYGRVSGWTPALPVPVEDIIERLFDLRILWDPLVEPPGQRILGALDPPAKTIVMNETHLAGVSEHIGPERFTLAHELGHWLYDAVDPRQESLLPETSVVFCRAAGATDLSASEGLRERNADRFAARLLLPSDLVRAALPRVPLDPAHLRRRAAEWGVSRRTLEIRLGELGLGAGAY